MVDASNLVGQSVRRKEDVRLLTGHGQFVDDISLPGMLYAAVLRSPYPHARIRSVDVSGALRLDGVEAVITGDDAQQLGKPMAVTLDLFTKVPTIYPLAVNKVRYVGEPVAAVAATSREVAEDAVELIVVDYEPLPPIVSIEDAEQPTSLLYEEWGHNRQLDWQFQVGDVGSALAGADVVISEDFPHHRYTGVPLESRVCLADYRPGQGALTVWMSTQAPHQCRTLFAQSLGLPEHQITVIAPDVGGGFGTKLQINAELIPVLLSIKSGRPVKWTEDRYENLVSGVHTRDYVCHLEVGFRRDGTMTGVKASLVGNLGCDGTCDAAGTAALLVAAAYLPGPYHVPAFGVDVVGYVTNKAPYGAYRGYGKDIANYPMERLMEMAAEKLHIDPLELRRRNVIQPDEYPYQQISGPLYDSGDYPAMIAKAREVLDYENFRRQQDETRREGKYLGIGFAAMLEPSGAAVPNGIFNGYEPATVRMTPEGQFLVFTGNQDIGQGIETTLAQVAASQFGVSVDDVRVVFGDTNAVPYGLGSFSSRGATYAVSAVHRASVQLANKLKRIAANILEASAADLVFTQGAVEVAGVPSRRLTLQELGNKVYLWPGPYGTVPPGDDPDLQATETFMGPRVRWQPDEQGRINLYTTHPTGIYAAIVEVDPELGDVRLRRFVVIHDAGVIINPLIAEAQVVGGVVQGMGGALWEELRYDEEGQFLSGDLTSYLLPTAPEIPDVEVYHFVSPSPFTPLGTKGMGEGGTIPTPAAILNAVNDALRPLNVFLNDLPITPQKVRAALRQAGH
ncbi:MAG: xanthine dehydrogenase family protein molybdopterin-binding subunit [Firmicutes bacterium]|nr:xanthine dehydrogenase family protein molybdopterin-binding subunit [Bacillota bacterium]